MAESSSSDDHEDPIVEEAANHSDRDVAQPRPLDAYSCQESDYGFSGVMSSDSDGGAGDNKEDKGHVLDLEEEIAAWATKHGYTCTALN